MATVEELRALLARVETIERALREDWADEIQQAVNREFEGMGFVMRADPDSGERYFSRRREPIAQAAE